MPYLRTTDNFYPLYDGDIKLIDSTFDGSNLPDGYVNVHPTTPPDSTPNHIVFEDAPEEIDGTYHQKWQVIALTDDQVEARRIDTLKMRMNVDGYTFQDIVDIYNEGSL